MSNFSTDPTQSDQAALAIEQLPMTDIANWLNDNQTPAADTFLLPGSVGSGSLAKSLPWLPATYINGWSDVGAPWETAAYLKDPLGFVHLKGLATGGANGTVAFVLPAGYRPGASGVYGALDSGGASVGGTVVDSSGNVTIYWSNNNVACPVSGITFLAEN